MIVAPTAVYRFYDEQDRLIYVGITDSPGTRWGQHSRRDWWPTVVRYTLSWHQDRTGALREESQAISSEDPLENIMGTTFDIDALTLEELDALPVWKPRETTRPRRAKGTGGLYQLSNGSWAASMNLGYDRRGMLKRKVFTAKTPEAALAKKEAWKAEQRASA